MRHFVVILSGLSSSLGMMTILMACSAAVVGGLSQRAAVGAENGPARSDSQVVRPIDDAGARAAGIRKIEGRHLTLYTDLGSNAEVDALPGVFDQAVPQWAAYFHVADERVGDWRVRCYLIGQRGPFDALGLMPQGADQFVHGIAFGAQLWLYDQPTAYYRRHLLLHEGTHAFMAEFLGGCGPGWYMEGTAELLATHRLEAGPELALNVMPRERAEAPMLGRIRLVRDAVAANRGLGLPEVMRLENRPQMENEGYAWCWAAAKFLDAHPRYQDRFRGLYRHVLEPDFNGIVRHEYAADWADLVTEWRAFVATLDHGYDFERMAIEFRRGTALGGRARTVTVAADRGWQSSGAWLEAGRAYWVTASGRYQIAREVVDGVERPWECEPGGVTIEYVDGRPLGMLLGAVERGATQRVPGGAEGAGRREREESNGPVDATLAHPVEIGLGRTIKPAVSGTLYLRVNDSGGRLDDNRGSLAVTIDEVADDSNSEP